MSRQLLLDLRFLTFIIFLSNNDISELEHLFDERAVGMLLENLASQDKVQYIGDRRLAVTELDQKVERQKDVLRLIAETRVSIAFDNNHGQLFQEALISFNSLSVC